MFRCAEMAPAFADTPTRMPTQALRKDKTINTKFSGTTAVMCLCRKEDDGLVIHSANAGERRGSCEKGREAAF